MFISHSILCLRHRWKTVPETYCIRVSLSVSECVSLCVLKTLWTPYLKNQWREFRPILQKLGHVYTWAWGILIRSKGQRSRSQQAEAWQSTRARQVPSSCSRITFFHTRQNSLDKIVISCKCGLVMRSVTSVCLSVCACLSVLFEL